MNALRRRLRARGQATVEFAITCIVLVPLVMYSMFMFDLLNFKLDAQEAVVAAPWDMTALDYEKNGDVQGPAKMIRRHHCDHFDAYDSFDTSYECGEAHHTDLSAHACWLAGKNAGGPTGQQVQCSVNQDVGKQGFEGNLPNTVNKGGKVFCTGRLGVVNYFLPQKILQDFSQTETTRAEQMGTGDSTHQFAMGHSSANLYLFELQKFSVLTDSWAMTTVEAADQNRVSIFGMGLGGGGDVLYARVGANWDSSKADKAKQVGDDLIDDKILNQMATSDFGHIIDFLALGDDPTTPQVGWKTELPNKIEGNFASPWNAQQAVQDTYNDRQNSYMGEAPK